MKDNEIEIKAGSGGQVDGKSLFEALRVACVRSLERAEARGESFGIVAVNMPASYTAFDPFVFDVILGVGDALRDHAEETGRGPFTYDDFISIFQRAIYWTNFVAGVSIAVGIMDEREKAGEPLDDFYSALFNVGPTKGNDPEK